jgi:hypothetical protein
MDTAPILKEEQELVPFTGIWDQNLSVTYYKEGRLHRERGAAIEWKSGEREYFWFGVLAKSKEQFADPAWREQAEANPRTELRML